MQIIGADEVARRLTWATLVEALRDAHRRPPPLADDMLVEPGDNRLLVRAAWIEGLGAGLKAVTVFPDNPSANPPRPAVQGQFLLFDEARGDAVALIEGASLTAWKTAADSALGADILARKDAATLTMAGAGAMAEPLVRAHLAVRPSISRVLVWNRTPERAEALALRLADLGREIIVTARIEDAVREADVVCCATMAPAPIVHGGSLSPGVHLDLVGSFTAGMREADDAALRRARIFADYLPSAFETGELADPIERGVICRDDVLGDLYDLVVGTCGRDRADEITLYKNAGGAHLDLMTARAIVSG